MTVISTRHVLIYIIYNIYIYMHRLTNRWIEGCEQGGNNHKSLTDRGEVIPTKKEGFKTLELRCSMASEKRMLESAVSQIYAV